MTAVGSILSNLCIVEYLGSTLLAFIFMFWSMSFLVCHVAILHKLTSWAHLEIIATLADAAHSEGKSSVLILQLSLS